MRYADDIDLIDTNSLNFTVNDNKHWWAISFRRLSENVILRVKHQEQPGDRKIWNVVNSLDTLSNKSL